MNASQAAQACDLVYRMENFPAIADLLKCDNFIFFEDDDTCALYCNNINTQYLIFRGTFSAPGWILDARFIPTTFDEFPGRVHRGFGIGWREFDKWFKGWHDINATLFVAGHSLGGAFATLTSMNYLTEHTYTFGCPRVGDSDFAAKYPTYLSANGKTPLPKQTRYVHDLDPVPQVPLYPFKHVVPETRIGGSSWFSAAWQHLTLGFNGSILAALDDHSMEHYVRLLK